MDFAELVGTLCKRPGMWVCQPYFSSVCAYIRGYNHARDGGPLAGFREWLIVRTNGGNNLPWEVLVRLIALPDSDLTGQLTTEQEASCLQGLASLLEEYLRFREENGITKVHYDYARWLLRRPWYSGPLRKKPGGSA
jgi:hypothetical protein